LAQGLQHLSRIQSTLHLSVCCLFDNKLRMQCSSAQSPAQGMQMCWGGPWSQALLFPAGDCTGVVASCGGAAWSSAPTVVCMWQHQVPQVAIFDPDCKVSKCTAGSRAQRVCSASGAMFQKRRRLNIVQDKIFKSVRHRNRLACIAAAKAEILSERREQSSVEVAHDSKGIANDEELSALADGLISQLCAGGDAQVSAVARAYELSMADGRSSRAVQDALERSPPIAQSALVSGFHGHVADAMESLHGNYVLQKIIQVMPGSSSHFIIEELLGSVGIVARHRLGCRVLCRLLENLKPDGTPFLALVEEILVDIGDLFCHNYGNYVISHILEFGLPEHKHKIACILCSDFFNSARSRNGARVIVMALTFCPFHDLSAMVSLMLQDQCDLVGLSAHQSGWKVVEAFLKLPEEHSKEVRQLLRPFIPGLVTKKYGRKTVVALGMPVTLQLNLHVS